MQRRSVNFEEHAAKPLLRAAGIATPDGRAGDQRRTRRPRPRAELGPCVVKAQVPTGKRGKAGGIKLAANADEARAAAAAHPRHDDRRASRSSACWSRSRCRSRTRCTRPCSTIPASKGPLLLFSAEGGMDIEEIAATHPDALVRLPIDIRQRPRYRGARSARCRPSCPATAARSSTLLGRLYAAYAANDAELMEINPLVVTTRRAAGRARLQVRRSTTAPSRAARTLAKSGTPDKLTALEARGKALGLKFIELDGNVGVLANGAGLTMTTMDAVRHFGGTPAELPRDRRRELHQGQAGARAGAVQPATSNACWSTSAAPSRAPT